MSNTENSIGTLVSISGTMASIGLAIVGILAAKSAIVRTETIADDFFLFASLGFIFVLALGYLVQKDPDSPRTSNLVTAAEWLFSLALLAMVVAAFLLVYAEV